MGTNYYIEKKEPIEKTLFQMPLRLHIGKSSGGWTFALNTSVIPTLDEWIKLFKDETLIITDEYGRFIADSEMVDIITKRSWDKGKIDKDDDFWERNHAVRGPNGLARAMEIPGTVVHGKGTYDLCFYDFC